MLVLGAFVVMFVGVGMCVVAAVEHDRLRSDKKDETPRHDDEEISPLLTRRASPVRGDSPSDHGWDMV